MGLKFCGVSMATTHTSKTAAVTNIGRAGTQRERVYRAIKFSGSGLTDEEVQVALRMSGNTERPRRIELLEAGFITDSTTRRKTQSGEWAVVWVTKG